MDATSVVPGQDKEAQVCMWFELAGPLSPTPTSPVLANHYRTHCCNLAIWSVITVLLLQASPDPHGHQLILHLARRSTTVACTCIDPIQCSSVNAERPPVRRDMHGLAPPVYGSLQIKSTVHPPSAFHVLVSLGVAGEQRFLIGNCSVSARK